MPPDRYLCPQQLTACLLTDTWSLPGYPLPRLPQVPRPLDPDRVQLPRQLREGHPADGRPALQLDGRPQHARRAGILRHPGLRRPARDVDGTQGSGAGARGQRQDRKPDGSASYAGGVRLLVPAGTIPHPSPFTSGAEDASLLEICTMHQSCLTAYHPRFRCRCGSRRWRSSH